MDSSGCSGNYPRYNKSFNRMGGEVR